jgi:hypothetical protein
MPVCKKCNTRFGCRVTIDGKYHNIGNRKFCLACSPFMGHNTRDISKTTRTKHDGIFTMCKCVICGREYEYIRSKGCTTKKCNTCMVNDRRFALKIKMVKYKGGKCVVCGYNKCLSALDFHHNGDSEKMFSISGAHCRKWSVLQEELDKCILVCKNCHSEIHDDIVISERESKRNAAFSVK